MQQDLRFEFQKFRILENLNFHPCFIHVWLRNDAVCGGGGGGGGGGGQKLLHG